MARKLTRWSSGLLAFGLWGCRLYEPVTTSSLLRDMTDLSGLSTQPMPRYTCRQFSSYDPAAKSPDDSNTWFANADAGQFIRQEEREGRTEYVLMDADGPGAIVRIWSANPQGTLYFYLDGAATPTWEVDMRALLSGHVAELPDPVACVRSSGWSLYFPIPYERHCKVTGDKIGPPAGHVYYHINYRTYPRHTSVRTFSPDELIGLRVQIAGVADTLANPPVRALPAEAPALQELRAGESLTWAPAERGNGAIYELRVYAPSGTPAAALRQVLLAAEFDGERTVLCPLTDFFGAGPGCHPYTSLPMGITPEGTLWSHWVMPYRQSAQLSLHNCGTTSMPLGLEVVTGEHPWSSASLHFHATWRGARDFATRPFVDWNYITIQGRGVFVGAAFTIANPVKYWWGEGDEKIYVDGEKFPSHFGTGTEDYYGYAWCDPKPFMHAYHDQPQCDGPGNYGRTAVNRWHILDRIPFKTGFRFDMEIWHSMEKVRIPEFAATTFWYARPGATCNADAPGAADMAVTELPPYVAPRVAGALEGEELRIVEHTGTCGPQEIPTCSNEQHLWWREGHPGETLAVVFAVPRAGRYKLAARFVKAADYGIAQISVNDATSGAPLDLYHDGVVVSDEVPLGTFELLAGENRLSVEIVGANEKAMRGYMFGLDYIRLEAVP